MPGIKFDPTKDIPELTGKVILVTGGTAGLGAGTVLELAKHNPSRILFTGRNAKSAESVVESARTAAPEVDVSFVQCDLASLASVKAASEKIASENSRLDIIMCNAGIMAKPPGLSVDGYEIQFATNHLGHALLVKKLLPVLESTSELPGSDVRIIILSSTGWRGTPWGVAFDDLRTTQEMTMGSWFRYGQSKLANLLYAKELARRYPKILSFSLTPGVVATGLVNDLSWSKRALVYATNIGKVQKPEEGTYNQLWAASANKETIRPGVFYEPVGYLSPMTNKFSRDPELAKKLWDWTDAELQKWM